MPDHDYEVIAVGSEYAEFECTKCGHAHVEDSDHNLSMEEINRTSECNEKLLYDGDEGEQLQTLEAMLTILEGQITDTYAALGRYGILKEWSKGDVSNGVDILVQRHHRQIEKYRTLCARTLSDLGRFSVSGNIPDLDVIVARLKAGMEGKI